MEILLIILLALALAGDAMLGVALYRLNRRDSGGRDDELLRTVQETVEQETEVLAALLAGARVRVGRDALEYRRYRRTAPLGIYQKCAGLERRLREMGICVAGTGGR